MKLTEEQELIIGVDEDFVVKAYSGTGKTTSLYHYIKTRKDESRILYLAFNKSVQEEAVRKFEDITNVYIHVKTVHSMAYRAIITKKNYKVEELTAEYIMNRYNCDYIFAIHVLKYFTLYSSSSFIKVIDVDYQLTISNEKSLAVFNEFKDEITLTVRKLVTDMYNNIIPVTHDYYLKLWYLSNPRLDKEYDYILIDEAQDASEVMLEVFKSQKCKKIAVGDEHQQIYSWRNAVNSLDKVNTDKVLKLTKSFRFGSNIADIANKIIKWKIDVLGDNSVKDFKIEGFGKLDVIKTHAVIARSNVRLISNAIDDIVLNKNHKKPYFEGGVKGYSVNSMYTPINDFHHIEKCKFDKIKTERLKNIRNFDELKEFIELTEDTLLSQALELYEKYGNKFNKYLTDLKDMCVEDKYESDIIYTTAHKSKGMEYDSVIILDDFGSKKDFILTYKLSDDKITARKKINEEINLLYVAVTRSKGRIILPNTILNDLQDEEDTSIL